MKIIITMSFANIICSKVEGAEYKTILIQPHGDHVDPIEGGGYVFIIFGHVSTKTKIKINFIITIKFLCKTSYLSQTEITIFWSESVQFTAESTQNSPLSLIHISEPTRPY